MFFRLDAAEAVVNAQEPGRARSWRAITFFLMEANPALKDGVGAEGVGALFPRARREP
jgi:hypothetical protein